MNEHKMNNKMNLHPTETKPYNPEDTWKGLIAVRTEIGKLREKLSKTLTDPMTTINNAEDDPWATSQQRKDLRSGRIEKLKSVIAEEISQIKSMESKLAPLVYWVQSSGDDDMIAEMDRLYGVVGSMVSRKEEQVASLDNEILSETLVELAERRG